MEIVINRFSAYAHSENSRLLYEYRSVALSGKYTVTGCYKDGFDVEARYPRESYNRIFFVPIGRVIRVIDDERENKKYCFRCGKEVTGDRCECGCTTFYEFTKENDIFLWARHNNISDPFYMKESIYESIPIPNTKHGLIKKTDFYYDTNTNYIKIARKTIGFTYCAGKLFSSATHMQKRNSSEMNMEHLEEMLGKKNLNSIINILEKIDKSIRILSGEEKEYEII